jgi:hypothetical protein
MILPLTYVRWDWLTDYMIDELSDCTYLKGQCHQKYVQGFHTRLSVMF